MTDFRVATQLEHIAGTLSAMLAEQKRNNGSDAVLKRLQDKIKQLETQWVNHGADDRRFKEELKAKYEGWLAQQTSSLRKELQSTKCLVEDLRKRWMLNRKMVKTLRAKLRGKRPKKK